MRGAEQPARSLGNRRRTAAATRCTRPGAGVIAASLPYAMCALTGDSVKQRVQRCGIDDVADVPIGAMDPLPARWAHERVVVQGGHHGNPLRMRQRRQVEREIQQIVDVDDVRLHGAQDIRDSIAQ